MNREHLAVSVFMFVLAFVINRGLAPSDAGARSAGHEADVVAALGGDLRAIDRLVHAQKLQSRDDFALDEARTWLRANPGSTLGALSADQALHLVTDLYRSGCTMIEIAHDDGEGMALYLEFPPLGRIRGRVRSALTRGAAAFPDMADDHAIQLGEQHGRFGAP